MQQVSRRQLLAVAGAAAGAATLGLAGCGSDDKGSSGGQDYSKNKEGAMEKYGAGDQFKATKALTFPIMMLSNPA